MDLLAGVSGRRVPEGLAVSGSPDNGIPCPSTGFGMAKIEIYKKAR